MNSRVNIIYTLTTKIQLQISYRFFSNKGFQNIIEFGALTAVKSAKHSSNMVEIAYVKINNIIYNSTQMNRQTFNLWLNAIGEALQAVNIFPKGLDLIKVIEKKGEIPTIINASIEEIEATNKIIQYIQNAY